MIESIIGNVFLRKQESDLKVALLQFNVLFKDMFLLKVF